MSIRQNFPTTQPSLVLDFANSKTLDPRITFSRTNPTATYMNENGLIVTAAADEPRFDHKIENGVVKSLGLLVEEQRQNLVTYSEDWNQHQAKANISIGINSITAPDGTLTADKLECTSSGDNNSGFVQKLVGISTSTDEYTTSWFVKRGNTDKTYLSTALSGGTYLAVYAYVDWTTTPVTFVYDGDNGSPTNTVHPIQEYTNDWYRASISIVNNNTNTQITNRIYSSSRTSTVTGDYLYAWGSQIEIGAFPTSYIPNIASSQKTRNPDNVLMTGTNFTDWYNNNEFTVFTQHRFPQLRTDLFARVFEISIEGNTGYRINHYHNPLTSGTRVGASCIENNNNQFAYTTGAYNIDDDVRIATRLKDNSFASYGNGTLFGFDDDGVFTTTQRNALYIGCDANKFSKLNGTISKLTYYPVRLTNTQLQNITK